MVRARNCFLSWPLLCRFLVSLLLLGSNQIDSVVVKQAQGFSVCGAVKGPAGEIMSRKQLAVLAISVSESYVVSVCFGVWLRQW